MNTRPILKTNEDGSVTLCARKTCCPVLSKVSEDKYKITDDDGNSILINREQAELIVEGIKAVEK